MEVALVLAALVLLAAGWGLLVHARRVRSRAGRPRH
jgi:hypothetical protein